MANKRKSVQAPWTSALGGDEAARPTSASEHESEQSTEHEVSEDQNELVFGWRRHGHRRSASWLLLLDEADLVRLNSKLHCRLLLLGEVQPRVSDAI